MIKTIIKIIITLIFFMVFVCAWMVAFIFIDNDKVKEISISGIANFMEMWNIKNSDLYYVR